MFTLSVETLDPVVLAAFARMFNELAAVGHAPQTMTATDYINKLDSPDMGVDTTGNATLNAATVFAQGGEFSPAQIQSAQSAAQVFATPSPNALPQEHASLESAAKSTVTIESTQVVQQPAALSSGAGVLVDSTGLPWDVRIHSGSRTQTSKAVWKAKKNVDPGLVAQVTAELRQAMAAPAAAPFVPLNAPAAPPPPVTQALVAPPPPAMTATAPPPPTSSPTQSGLAVPTTFVELSQYITARGIPAPTITKICNDFGLAGFGLVACRPDLVPQICQAFATL